MNFALQAITMFLIACITDIVWFLYIQKVSEKKRLAAANYSVITCICGIIWVEGMLSNIYLMLFWIAGLWVGTYFADEIELWVKRTIK